MVAALSLVSTGLNRNLSESHVRGGNFDSGDAYSQ